MEIKEAIELLKEYQHKNSRYPIVVMLLNETITALEKQDMIEKRLLDFGCKYCKNVPCMKDENGRCIGFEVDMDKIISDLEKQVPKEATVGPVPGYEHYTDMFLYTCPECGGVLSDTKTAGYRSYCNWCGQKLKGDSE